MCPQSVRYQSGLGLSWTATLRILSNGLGRQFMGASMLLATGLS